MKRKAEIRDAIKAFFKERKDEKLLHYEVWRANGSNHWYVTTVSISERGVVFKETWHYNPENSVCKIEFINVNGCIS